MPMFSCAIEDMISYSKARTWTAYAYLYEQMLCKPYNRDDVRIFMQWLVFASRHVTLDELAEVVTIDLPLGEALCHHSDLR